MLNVYGKPVMWAINKIIKRMARQIGFVEIQCTKAAGMPQRGDHAAEKVVGVLSCSQKEVTGVTLWAICLHPQLYR